MDEWRSILRKILPVACVLCLLGVTAAGAGMAELGRRRNLIPGPESDGTDVANGDGSVIIRLNGVNFAQATSVGQTVSEILELLEAQINANPSFFADHPSGSPEITVLPTGGPSVLTSVTIINSDSGFGFVKSTRAARGAVSVDAASEPPTGDGSVEIIVDDEVARAAVVSTAGFAGDSAGLNAALVEALIQNSFQATLSGGEIRVTRDLLQDRKPLSISWEDTDGGPAESLVLIGATSESEEDGSGGAGTTAPSIPTLSEWAMILLALLLATSAIVLLIPATPERRR